MTEDEAKTKWCPFARVVAGSDAGAKGATVPHGVASGYNRVALPEDALLTPYSAKCLGASCMAWRRYQSTEMRGQGYCGLAGQQ